MFIHQKNVFYKIKRNTTKYDISNHLESYLLGKLRKVSCLTPYFFDSQLDPLNILLHFFYKHTILSLQVKYIVKIL